MVTILHEKNWTVGKKILNTLMIIAMIGLCNYSYHSIYFSQTFILIELIDFQLEALVVSFLPVSFIGLLLISIISYPGLNFISYAGLFGKTYVIIAFPFRDITSRPAAPSNVNCGSPISFNLSGGRAPR